MGNSKYSVLKMWLKLFDTASHVRVVFGDSEDSQCDLAVRLGAYVEPGDSFDLSMFLYTCLEIISCGPQ